MNPVRTSSVFKAEEVSSSYEAAEREKASGFSRKTCSNRASVGSNRSVSRELQRPADLFLLGRWAPVSEIQHPSAGTIIVDQQLQFNSS